MSNIFDLFVSLLFSAGFSTLIAVLYIKFGDSNSNRKKFAANFILLAVATTAIIMIIKNSIALSLGLVGALSIVRFRAAIKDPEELIFLFLTIAVGIGAGANEYLTVTMLCAVSALIIIVKRSFFDSKLENFNYNLNIITDNSEDALNTLSTSLDKFSEKKLIKRFDDNHDTLDLLYYVEFKSQSNFLVWRKEIKETIPKIQISYLSEDGVF